MSTYKWDQKKWEKDEEWWNPYNPKGRLKGKGTTSWARQLRRQAQQPLQKEAENQKELAEGQPAELPKPLEKRPKETNQQHKQPLEKWQKKQDTPLEKRQKHQKQKKKKNMRTRKMEKKMQKQRKNDKAMEVDKEEKKAAQPLEKRQEESAQSSTAQSSSAAKQEQIAAASASEAEPDPEHSWEEKKSKRKKQPEKKEAREQQKEPASYLEVVVKGGPLQKGQNQPKKKGKLDGRQQYVSLGTSSSSSSLAQPPTPPKPSRLRGTPAQPEREGLPERQPPTPPPPKPLKKRLALDWHNCFQIREKGEDVVPNSHIRAYWDLQADGWEIFLLSFAGRERGQEVLQWAKSLPIKWAGMKIVTERTGCWGKAEWALHFKCTHVLDDTPEILRESLEKGLKVVPISTYWERHQWAKKQGIQVYPDFVAAVADLVEL